MNIRTTAFYSPATKCFGDARCSKYLAEKSVCLNLIIAVSTAKGAVEEVKRCDKGDKSDRIDKK